MSPSKEKTFSERSQEKPKITIAQTLLIGCIAGIIEVLINHPFWTIKTRIQNNQPLTFKRAVLYRGILPNAASTAPITGIQLGLDNILKKFLFKDSISNTGRATSAFLAGAGSALISCPTEMVMTHQGLMKTGFISAAKHIVKQGGWSALFKGLTGTAMRDGLFAMSFLFLTPSFKEAYKPHCNNEVALSLSAGMSAGIMATLSSQAFDTTKTYQQKQNPKQTMGVSRAISEIYSTKGLHGFFKGGLPRACRVVSAVTIISNVTSAMKTRLSDHNTLKCQ